MKINLITPALLLIAIPVCIHAQTEIQKFNSTEIKFAAVDKEFSDSSVVEGPYKAFLKFTTEDSYIFPTHRAPEYGRGAIQKFYGDFPSSDSLIWIPVEARCSNDGSVGYTIGEFRYVSKDSSGNYSSRAGRYMTVWKEQKDGSLRAIADMGSPQKVTFDSSGKQISVRQALLEEVTADFQIEAGTFRTEELQSAGGGEIKRGNYITAWQLIGGGVKRVIADYQN